MRLALIVPIGLMVLLIAYAFCTARAIDDAAKAFAAQVPI